MGYLYRTTFFIVLVWVSSIAWAEDRDGHTGRRLLERCESVLKIASPDLMNFGWCLGFLEGLDDMGAASGARFYCLPDNASFGQQARVVVKYLNDHPEKLHEIDVALAIAALREAFPCEK